MYHLFVFVFIAIGYATSMHVIHASDLVIFPGRCCSPRDLHAPLPSAPVVRAPAAGLTASADFSARLWDAVTGNQIHEFVHKHIVKSVHFAADRSKLATAGHEGILRIFDVASPGSAPTEASVMQYDY